MREKDGFREELAFITERLGKKGFYSTREIAFLDYGELGDKKDAYVKMRAVRNRYGITEGGMTAVQLAHKRAEM